MAATGLHDTQFCPESINFGFSFDKNVTKFALRVVFILASELYDDIIRARGSNCEPPHVGATLSNRWLDAAHNNVQFIRTHID